MVHSYDLVHGSRNLHFRQGWGTLTFSSYLGLGPASKFAITPKKYPQNLHTQEKPSSEGGHTLSGEGGLTFSRGDLIAYSL